MSNRISGILDASGNPTNGNGRQAQLHDISRKRIRFAREAGFQYGGDRDIYEVAGYVVEGDLEFDHYWSYYQRNEIAGRIVDMPAQTTWRNPPEIMEPERESSEFVDAVEGLVDRLDLWHRFERADRLARIGRFGVLMIGVAEEGDDADLEEPMPMLTGPDDVLYFSAFPEGDVDVLQWEDDPSNPRFGMPNIYQIDLAASVSGFPLAAAKVHHSRVIHIAEDLLADEVFGRPAMKRVMNRIFDSDKVAAASGEAFWQLADRILTASIDPEAQISDKQIESLDDHIQELYHELRRTFYGKGVELDWLGGDAPDPTGVDDVIMRRIAVGTGIPKRILFGSETGERASTEDQKTWLGIIGERIERHAEPTILRATLNRLIEHGGLPEPQDDYDVVWPNLFEVPEKDEAEIDLARAKTADALTAMGGNKMDIVEITDEGRVMLRPTGERGPLAPDELEPPEMEPPTPPPFEDQVDEEGDEDG